MNSGKILTLYEVIETIEKLLKRYVIVHLTTKLLFNILYQNESPSTTTIKHHTQKKRIHMDKKYVN